MLPASPTALLACAASSCDHNTAAWSDIVCADAERADVLALATARHIEGTLFRHRRGHPAPEVRADADVDEVGDVPVHEDPPDVYPDLFEEEDDEPELPEHEAPEPEDAHEEAPIPFLNRFLARRIVYGDGLRHTMSARSRTAAGPRERGRSRAVPEVFCEGPLTNNPLHNRTRTRSFGLSHGLCSVSCMISVLCLAELLQCFSSHESCVTGCHSFHRILGSTFLHTSGSRQASSHDRTASVGLFSQDTRVGWSLLARHTSWLVSSQLPITSQYPRPTAAPQRRAASRLLCNCQDTRILTSQWPSCTCESFCRVSPLLCISVFFCVRRSTRTQFLHAPAFRDDRIHSFLSTSITRIDGSSSSSSGWRCTTARQAM